MTNIICNECGAEVSDTLTACPRCMSQLVEIGTAPTSAEAAIRQKKILRKSLLVLSAAFVGAVSIAKVIDYSSQPDRVSKRTAQNTSAGGHIVPALQASGAEASN
jgi:predicted ATP-dependent serine protease